MKTHVRNMVSHSGNDVANQFIIEDEQGSTFFQSYRSIIAKKDSNGNATLDSKYWDYSTTTGKYRNMFLGEDIKTTLA